MAVEWTDKALVLRVGRFREADMWVRLLVPSRGIVQAFAFGGSRSRRRFCGCLDLLNTVLCRVRATGNGAYLSLQEGTLLHAPMALRRDHRRLGVAVNCVRFTEALGVEAADAPLSQPAPQAPLQGVAEPGALFAPPLAAGGVVGKGGLGCAAFALLGAALRLLEGEREPQGIFPLQYRLRLASEQGQAPALDVCGVCGAPVDAGYFRVDEAHMLCPVCAARAAGASGRYRVRLGRQALAALRVVQAAPPDAWGQAPLEGEELRQCARAIDGFVQYHLGIAWQDGRFCRV